MMMVVMKAFAANVSLAAGQKEEEEGTPMTFVFGAGFLIPLLFLSSPQPPLLLGVSLFQLEVKGLSSWCVFFCKSAPTKKKNGGMDGRNEFAIVMLQLLFGRGDIGMYLLLLLLKKLPNVSVPPYIAKPGGGAFFFGFWGVGLKRR